MPSSTYPATLPQTVWTTVASDEVRSSESSVLSEFPADSEHLQQPMTADETIERKNRVLAFMMTRSIIN